MSSLMSIARIISYLETKKPRKTRLLFWLPHKDSNLNKQIQNVRAGWWMVRKWAFFGLFVSLCFLEMGCIAASKDVKKMSWIEAGCAA